MTTAIAQTPPPIRRRTKVAYGLGAVAFGVRDTGFNTFVLIFYNQVLGLPAALAGLALMLTLIADAVLDPLIGMVSDSWRSPLGRRHPFLFAAAIPAAASFALLWNPPNGLTGPALFWWLLGASVLARGCMSLFEVPFVSLAAELTRDYDQRTSLFSWLFVFGWWSGLAMAVLGYAVFLRPGPGDPSGLLNRHGFAAFGLTGSLVMLTAMLLSAVGTRSVQTTRIQGPASPFGFRRALKTLRSFAGNPSLVALMASTIIGSAGDGFSGSVYNYLQAYFWGLNTSEIALQALAPVLSAALALYLAPRLARGREKRDLAIGLAVVGTLGQPVPVILRLLGLFPVTAPSVLVPVLVAHSAFEVTVWILFGVVVSSMIADLAEDHQRRTGERPEGALFSLRIFAQKTVSGLGVMVSGAMLGLIGFPDGARPGRVPAGVVAHLGLGYAISLPLLDIAAIACLCGYRLTRAGHAQNLAFLAEGARSAGFQPATGASCHPQPAE